MDFNDLLVFQKERFSIGQENNSGKYYLSFPVSNGLAEYEEYYEITLEEFKQFSADHELLKTFANECKKQKQDQRLIIKPGTKRGMAT